MSKLRLVVVCLFASVAAFGQGSYGRGLLVNRPQVCNPGDNYFATDQSAGSQQYVCTTLNVWALFSGSGGGGSQSSYMTNGAGAGYFGMNPGTGQSVPANTWGWEAPPGGTPFFGVMPSVLATGLWHCVNATPSPCSISKLDLVNDIAPNTSLPWSNTSPSALVGISGNYQVLTTDFSSLTEFTVVSGSPVFTLVASTSQPLSGQFIKVVNYGSGTPTVVASGQTLYCQGGSSGCSLPTGFGVTVSSDGANYIGETTGGQVASVTGSAGITVGGTASNPIVGFAAVANNSVPCNNSGSSAAPTVANCTVTGTGDPLLVTPMNNAVVVTSGSGVPSESTTLPTGLALQTPASGVGTNITGVKAGIIQGYCAATVGTATSTEYYLVPWGVETSPLCTATSVVAASMPVACTAGNLFARSAAAGHDSTSGVVTMYHNGTQSTVTCTLGTGTSCSDASHTVSFAQGDTYYVGVETSTSFTPDTTASIRVTFTCN